MKILYTVLIRRLEQFTKLSSQDREALRTLCQTRSRHIGARQQIIREGDKLRAIPFIVKGWACRYKHLEDGRGQILSFCVPGDLCSSFVPLMDVMDHSTRTITDAIVLDFSYDQLESVAYSFPRLARAFNLTDVVQAAISREWILSLGQRKAKERCAYIICELFWRLRAVGLTDGTTMDFPLTQEEIGGTIGVSTVHTNRVLQDLRGAGLIEQQGKRLKILDLRALERCALFNGQFLHLESENSPINVPVAALCG